MRARPKCLVLRALAMRCDGIRPEAERRLLDRQTQDIRRRFSRTRGPGSSSRRVGPEQDIQSGLPVNVHGLEACGSDQWYLGLVVLNGNGAQPFGQLTNLGEAVSWEHAKGHELLDCHVESLGNPSELVSAFGHGFVREG